MRANSHGDTRAWEEITVTSGYAQFCARGAEVLPALVPHVVARARSGEMPIGRWHPYGFAVYKVDQIARLGTVRLHIWSDHGRIAKPRHPPVHEHEWHLAGLVIAGTYVDELHDVAPTRGRGDAEVYEIETTPAGIDRFRPTGQTVGVRGRGVQPYHVGEIHFIEAGLFHASPIPQTSFAATLALTSPPAQTRRSIVGRLPAAETEYVRPTVTQVDHERLIAELLSHLV